jgi:stage V sporulation protein G
MTDTKLDVRVYPIDEPKGNTLAFASVGVDDLVAIRGIRVIEGEKGQFVAMPQSKDKEDNYHDIAFPVTAELRKDITRAVLDEYDRAAALPPDQRGYGAPDMSAASSKQADEVNFDVRVYPIGDPKGCTKAFASVGVEDLIAIRGVRVVEGENGLFVSMPQSKDKDGEYHDIAFPLSGDLRKEISKAILNEFEAVEMTVDRKQSLSGKLAEGVDRAAAYNSPQKSAAKSRGAGVLA